MPLLRWRLPLPAGSCPAKGRPPLRLALSPLLAAKLAIGGSPLRVPYSRPSLWAPHWKLLSPLRIGRNRLCPRVVAAPAVALLPVGAAPYGRRWPPFRVGPGRSQPPPCKGPWPWPGLGWSALHGGWPPLLLAAFATKI
ncbi:hypothetical protein BHM03_00023236 [Ensete ventricosum]|nr:hypothetical protein BHM03_00023236 [Ensete ventricosum]